jgi:hypothetical protein
MEDIEKRVVALEEQVKEMKQQLVSLGAVPVKKVEQP